MNYYIYKPISYTYRALFKKILKTNKAAKSNFVWQKEYGKLIKEKPVLTYDLSCPIIILEEVFFREPVCILPETHILIDQVLETNFEGQVSTLKPIKEAFIIAIPKEKLFNNQIIEGIFVSYTTSNIFKNKYLKDFNEKYGVNISTQLVVSEGGEDAPILTIAYRDPLSKEVIILTSVLSNYRNILSSSNAGEYKHHTKKSGNEPISNDLSEQEYNTQYQVVRFVLGFIVYMSAHPDNLKDVTSIKMPGSTKQDSKLSINTIRHFKPRGSVTPHYRNLKDERYYRNEWSDWPPGSRWVPVNMETVLVEEELK